MNKKKLARLAAGLRQIDVAIKTGFTPSYISYVENDLIEPTPERAKKLNKILGQRVYNENA